MTLQHVVLMKFPTDLDPTEDGQLRGMVASWPTEIGTMGAVRIGRDLTGERTRGYQYLLYMEFPDTQTLAEYVAHPVHQKLVRWLDKRDCTRLAFDYYIDDLT